MKDIAIIGYGNIGKHTYDELCNAGNIFIYDPYNPNYNQPILKCDIAFICVPTDMKDNGSCDTSIVETVVQNTNSDIIVIKSTIPVGTCDYLSQTYHKRIVFSPEYYGTTIQSPKAPNFVILAGNKEDCREVAELYYKVKGAGFRIKFTDYKTAELAKYMENCFLALKVTFCCEFADIAKDFGISYPELRELFVMDERMGDSHTYVDSERPYYDSHCLNKDIPALVNQSDKALLMKSCMNINLKKK